MPAFNEANKKKIKKTFRQIKIEKNSRRNSQFTQKLNNDKLHL